MGDSEDKMTYLEMEFVVSRVQDNSTGVLQLLGERGELIAAEKIFFFIHVVFYIITRPVSDRR